jgi:hypothetical protein
MTDELEMTWKKTVVTDLKVISYICLEELRKTTIILRQDMPSFEPWNFRK